MKLDRANRNSLIGNFLICVSAVAILALALEFGSYLVLRAEGGVIVSSSYPAIYQRSAVILDLRSTYFLDEIEDVQTYRRSHPYFGHVFSHANNYGFLSPFDFPYPRQKDDFVVGIFGGSTAMFWANSLTRTHIWDHLKVSGRARRIVILNLAIAGMHQPQQLYVASKFMDGLDLAIVLDGWNDAVNLNCPQAPPELPQFYWILFPNERLSPLRVSILRTFTESDRSITGWLGHSSVNKSYFIYFAWGVLQNSLRNYTQELQRDDSAKAGIAKRQSSECAGSYFEANFRTWRKYTLQMKALARLYRVPLFHFLQPNPYIPGAKPLGDEEKRIVDFSNYSSIPRERSPISAAEKFRELYDKERPRLGTDLSYVFAREPAIMYLDGLTHLNAQGYEHISEAVLNRLRESHLAN